MPTRAKKHRISPSDAMELLGAEYGPLQWRPRYDAASELVFTILSQHTSDTNSERAFGRLFDTFGSLESIAGAEVKEIEEAIRPAGLFRIKAARIKEVLNTIHDELGSYDLSFLAEMPLGEAKSWLRKLNGIGPKTAAIILCFSLGMPAMPVDTHIYRVARRLGMVGPKVTADQAHDILEPMVAPEDVFAFHLYLITHGRRVCKSQRPQCEACVLAWGCPSRDEFKSAVVSRARKRSMVGAREPGKAL